MYTARVSADLWFRISINRYATINQYFIQDLLKEEKEKEWKLRKSYYLVICFNYQIMCNNLDVIARMNHNFLRFIQFYQSVLQNMIFCTNLMSSQNYKLQKYICTELSTYFFAMFLKISLYRRAYIKFNYTDKSVAFPT